MDFSPFFLHKISMMPTVAPVKNATYKAKTTPIGPRIRPITNANLTSTNPHPRPLVRIYTARKNKNASEPLTKWGIISSGLNKRKIDAKIPKTVVILSGIM